MIKLQDILQEQLLGDVIVGTEVEDDAGNAWLIIKKNLPNNVILKSLTLPGGNKLFPQDFNTDLPVGGFWKYFTT